MKNVLKVLDIYSISLAVKILKVKVVLVLQKTNL